MCLEKDNIVQCKDNCAENEDFEVLAMQTLEQAQTDSHCRTEEALCFGKRKIG